MFIKSMMDTLVTYRKNDFVIELKPNAINEVDETLVSLKELKDCYGDRVYEIDPKLLEDATEIEDETDNKTEGENGNNDLTPDEAETINLEYQKKLAEAEEALEELLKDELKRGFISDIQVEATKFCHTYDAISLLDEFNKRYDEYLKEQEDAKKDTPKQEDKEENTSVEESIPKKEPVKNTKAQTKAKYTKTQTKSKTNK